MSAMESASRCDKCGDIVADIDAGFSPGLQQMAHECGGAWKQVLWDRATGQTEPGGRDGKMNHYHIEIACDHHEGEQFRDWLNAQGHDAKIGRSTGNYVDGVWTSGSAPDEIEASETLGSLWAAYCNG